MQLKQEQSTTPTITNQQQIVLLLHTLLSTHRKEWYRPLNKPQKQDILQKLYDVYTSMPPRAKVTLLENPEQFNRMVNIIFV
jgi:hypothetical protein